MNERFKFRVYFKGSDYAKAGYQDLTRKDVIYSLDTNGKLIRDCIYECQQDGHEGSPCHMPFVQNNDMYIVQFCTGLKDKNGKLIYEGDIISGINGSINGSGMDFKTIIKWNNDNCCFNTPKFRSDENSTHWYEVIGNIYETPELLEKNND